MRWQIWGLFGTFIAFLFLIRGVLPPFIVGLVLAYVLNPLVNAVTRRTKLPRLLVVGVLYVALLAGLITFVRLVVPAVIEETQSLLRNGPDLIDALLLTIAGTKHPNLFGTNLTSRSLMHYLLSLFNDPLTRPDATAHVVSVVFSSIFNTIVTLFVTFYFLWQGQDLFEGALSYLPRTGARRVRVLRDHINVTMGRYMRGQLLLIGLMASVTYLTLRFVFHLHYALSVAIATGVLEIVPIVGPILAGAIATAVAVGQIGPSQTAEIIIAYTILRQVEDQLIMPIVLGRAVRLHPVVTLFAVLCGGTIAGLLGIILAIPIAAIAKIILDELRDSWHAQEVPRLETRETLPED